MRWLMRNPEILIAVIVVGSSFLQWLVRKLREQQEVNAQRQAERRLREESLRTGRPVEELARAGSSAQAEAAKQRRLREIAARRQSQLEELRRRQAQAAGQRATTSGATVSAPPRATSIGARARAIPQGSLGSGPIVPMPAGSRSPQTKRKTPRPPGAQPTGSTKRSETRRAEPEPVYTRGLASSTPADVAPLIRAHDTGADRAGGASALLGRADWRSAIVWIEALSPPLSIREGSALDPLGR